jgi:putative ABC transport system substrate-binding protein
VAVGGAGAEQDRMRKVGFLISLREDDPDGQTRASVLRKGLADIGWTEDRNIHIDYRWIGGDAVHARAYAGELVGLTPDVIVANSTLSLKAVQKETSSIPIVFVFVADPVGQGFVASLAHPGGNTTGFTGFEFAMGGKWLELLKEIAPDVRRIAFIFNPQAGLPYAEQFVETLAQEAPARGVELIASLVRDPAEIDRAIVRVASESKSGLIVNPDAFILASRGLIISLAARYHLPAIYPFKYCAVDGGLLSYGVETNDLFRRAAIYVDKILKGAKPADLPVQNPTKFEFIINLKTGRSLGRYQNLRQSALARRRDHRIVCCFAAVHESGVA